jgi:hypothetical protein
MKFYFVQLSLFLNILLKIMASVFKNHYICGAKLINTKHMKKLFFLLLPLLIFACKGAEQYRAGIEEVSGNWDTTTKAISDFSAMVSTDMTNYTKALGTMHVDEEAAKKMKPEQMTAQDAAQKTAMDALSAYTPLQKAINDFLQTWTEKTADVNSLKDGLAKGKIEGDVNAKLTELRNMITTANENLTAWKSSYATVKNGVATALGNLQQTMSSTATPAEPMKKK